MKKELRRAGILFFIMIAVSFTAFAQIYVTARPIAPKIAKPKQPSPAHVWVEEDWNTREGKYEYSGGHWKLPPHPGWVWVPGRWIHDNKGWQWIQGRWRRGRRY